jgi:hypothetical protein
MEIMMRWIACCVLAAGVGFGASTMLLKHFGSKPSEPNLVELGLSNDLSELAAPGDPEPVVQRDSNSGKGSPNDELIDLLSKPLVAADKPTAAASDPELKPTSFVDAAGIVELDNLAHQWMPLCCEPESGPTGISVLGREPASERMPRCEETPLPRPTAKAEKPD